MGKSNLKEKVSTTWNNVVLHWKTPALGKYVSYKEIIAYGVGGMGVQFVMFFCSLIALSATSFLVGNTIGIKPMHLQYMAVASTIIGFGITIGRSYIIDSARFKSGKFRPWLAITGIPTVIIAVVFVWLPYETMSYMQKVIAVFLCYNLLQCFYPFFQQAYTDLANVISPNSHERTDIVSVSSIIYSMAPSLTGLFVPMLSTLTGGLNSITTYRIIHPIVAIVGLLLSYIAYAGTRERIIVAESHVTQFKFSDAFRAVAKNKYFWITSLAGWLGFLEGAVGVIIGWTFIYAYPDRMGLYGVATTLIGNAALWAMLICPIAIRVLGKENLLIWCNVTNVVLIGLLYPLYNNIPALIILYYLNGFINSFSIVYNPGINADMRDYQQYFTGERIDGMFGAVGIIGSFIGMFTGMVLPTIYQMLGLEDNYDVLEVASFREDMFDVLIIAAVIGAALNFVPYLFYDLTETKQRGIVKVLKIRAMFEDYGNGILRDESIVEAIDIIDEANLLYKDRTLMTTKDDIKKAERLPARTPEEKEFKKNEIKRLKAAYKEFNTQNRGIKKDRINQAKAMPKSTDPANTREHIYNTLVSTDIVYAGGGNLEFMMNTFKATGADEALREAYKRGKVLSGLSSGAMCWFDMGYDDCGENGSFMFIDCIGLLPYCYCPHFISERWQSFGTAVIGCRVSGIGAEDGAALIFKDGHFSAMCGNDGGSVFYFDKNNGFAKSDITEDASALDI
ncbi:MAG: MFS transporter [Acutalibacteraceae bacterium]